MYVLGLGGSNHDFSSCLLHNGKIVCMIEEERITRKKHGLGLGIEVAKGASWKYCLKQAGIGFEQISQVVANDILLKSLYFRIPVKVSLINHHLAHAASCFYPSGFQEAAVMVVDAVGSRFSVDGKLKYETVSLYKADNKGIHPLFKQYGVNLPGTDYIENSLGVFYSVMTQVAGFNEMEEGKTMGLAPYGSDKRYQEVKQYLRLTGNGCIKMTANDIYALLEIKNRIDHIEDPKKQFEERANYAWAAQKVTEDVMVYFAAYLQKLTGSKRLCLAGGVVLNSVANYKIYKLRLFDQYFIQPAAGDNGTAIGSAFYGYNNLYKA